MCPGSRYGKLTALPEPHLPIILWTFGLQVSALCCFAVRTVWQPALPQWSGNNMAALTSWHHHWLRVRDIGYHIYSGSHPNIICAAYVCDCSRWPLKLLPVCNVIYRTIRKIGLDRPTYDTANNMTAWKKNKDVTRCIFTAWSVSLYQNAFAAGARLSDPAGRAYSAPQTL